MDGAVRRSDGAGCEGPVRGSKSSAKVRGSSAKVRGSSAKVRGSSAKIRGCALMRSITSRQNPVVARFRMLADTADPTGARVLLDGVHLVREAQEAGSTFEVVAVSSSRVASDSEEARVAHALSKAGVEVVQAPDAVFDAMSPVRSPSGIAAIVTRRAASASEVCAGEDALVLVALDVQDPGNVG